MKIAPAIQTNARMALVAIIDPEDMGTLEKLRAILPDGALRRVCLPAELQSTLPRTLPPLTQRQAAILPLLMTSLSNKEIGRRLAISHFTVRNHISQILRALEVPSRKAARAVLSNMASADQGLLIGEDAPAVSRPRGTGTSPRRLAP
jgi:DNA-binding NarL/FixJ family response regulator